MYMSITPSHILFTRNRVDGPRHFFRVYTRPSKKHAPYVAKIWQHNYEEHRNDGHSSIMKSRSGVDKSWYYHGTYIDMENMPGADDFDLDDLSDEEVLMITMFLGSLHDENIF